jgi:hypothetical protein
MFSDTFSELLAEHCMPPGVVIEVVGIGLIPWYNILDAHGYAKYAVWRAVLIFMLTLFTIPKAFEGHIGVIQRNAIKSWTLLDPKCQIILVGDDEGTDRAADELGVKHIPNVNRNEFGTPLLDSAYQLAEEAAAYPLLCYINADIILTSSFIQAAGALTGKSDWFMMTARRWNLDVTGDLDFPSGWEDGILQDLSDRGHLGHHTEIDFWLYTKGLLPGIPPLAVGRMAFECWCLYKARSMKADLVDATGVVVSIHQNHDYSHHPDGNEGIGTSVEAELNRKLVGGKPYFFTIRDRTHILTQEGLKRSRDGWRLWRGLRSKQVLDVPGPPPIRLMAKILNNAINAGRDLLVLVARGRTG